MKKFKDALQREWSLVVNVGTAKKVKDLVGVDLFNIYSSEAERVFSDPILLVNVLYVLCETQCKERNVTEESFGEGLVGDPIEQASQAMLEEVANFFPSSRRAIALKTLEKSMAAAQIMETKAMMALDSLDMTSLRTSLQQPTK